MRKQVYLETTIVSYLTARPSRDLIRAARQQLTRDWWQYRRGDFDLHISQFVLDEAGDGDPDAARRRLEFLEGLPLLETNEQAIELAEALTSEGALPDQAATDALHIAMATVHSIDVLLTWNCRHLANAELLGDVSRLLWAKGFSPPIICTPEELLGE